MSDAYSMTDACPGCKQATVKSDLPSGETVIVDAEPILAVVIGGSVGSVEPRIVSAYPIHRCQRVK